MKRIWFYTIFAQALFLSFIHCCLFFSPCYGMETEEIEQRAFPKMKFKLGFEFQEGSGLCPWALGNQNIQKKPLFSFKDKKEGKKKKRR